MKPSKKAITAAALAGGSSKAKKKKWSKGKTKDKANNAVIFEKAAYDRIVKDIGVYKAITPSYLVDRHHINCSLARALLKELEAKGAIRKVLGHNTQQLYAKVEQQQVLEVAATVPVNGENAVEEVGA